MFSLPFKSMSNLCGAEYLMTPSLVFVFAATPIVW
jgi:hypothetical protein